MPRQGSRPPVRDRTGELVGGRYRLEELIDRGGQGQVYRARDERDRDEVAIKVLNDTVAADPESRERMFREARALTSLGGTAAVRVLDQVWSADAALCLVMELLHGRPFDEHLGSIEATGRRLDVSDLVRIIDPVIWTLETAHSQGIVHRDIKPANLFVIDAAHGGGVRLLDFGFAKFTRLRSFTADGFVAGSPSYLAPECWRGARDLDARVDVYSMGAVIFRALAGAPPFTGALEELLRDVTSAPRPSLHALRRDLPPAVDEWVEQVLAADPDLRFMRIRGMWMAFRSLFR